MSVRSGFSFEPKTQGFQQVFSYSKVNNKNTFNEVKHFGLHVFEKDANTDSGEVAVSHLLVSEHPLQKPLQMGLGGLQALPTPGEICYVWRSLSTKETNKHLH